MGCQDDGAAAAGKESGFRFGRSPVAGRLTMDWMDDAVASHEIRRVGPPLESVELLPAAYPLIC